MNDGLALSLVCLTVVISPLFSIAEVEPLQLQMDTQLKSAETSDASKKYYKYQMQLVNKAIESYKNSDAGMQLQMAPALDSDTEVSQEYPDSLDMISSPEAVLSIINPQVEPQTEMLTPEAAMPEVPVIEAFQSTPNFNQNESSEVLQNFGLQKKFCEFCNGASSKEMPHSFTYDDTQVPVRSVMLDISNNPLPKKIERVAKKEKHLKSSGYCWRSVKSILVRAGLVKEGELSSPIARDADKDLKRLGFVDLMAPGQPLQFYPNPCLAPKGAVLVYSGGKIQIDPETGKPRCGKRPCGHVEVKASNPGEPGVISDFMARESIVGGCFSSGHSYKLKAIMIPQKLDEGLYDKITSAENLYKFVKSLFENINKPIDFRSSLTNPF